ncbi:MAG TPA: bifunctional adenosylcobinamide kinase/adenosylcobinamide-phosphate guanylyltransferase, partial [Trichocoleus sp.]
MDQANLTPNLAIAAPAQGERRALITLVTGPTRSGKSEWAEHLAQQSGKSVVYIATSQVAADDLEWAARLEKHRQRRPTTW